MLPDQLFYNTGIYTYVWLLTNNKPSIHKGKVMILDARKQFEKEPKSFGNKRHHIPDKKRKWIEERYRNGWEGDFSDENVKIFCTIDFAYHKVKVVFWQTDENDKPDSITEQYTKAFSSTNIRNEQKFYNSDLKFKVTLKSENNKKEITFTLTPEDSFTKVYEPKVKDVFLDEIDVLTKKLTTTKEKNKVIKKFIKSLDVEAEFTHRHYIKDNEYIPVGDDIEKFLKREIGKEIIYWEDSPQLGYEILPNKYFYKYEPPKPANEILIKFWKLEEKAEEMLKNLSNEQGGD